jgi:carbonic anhydrase
VKSTVLVYVLVFAIFSGCGSVGRRRAKQEEPPPPAPVPAEAAQPVPVKEEPKPEQPPQEMTINLKKDEVVPTEPKHHQRVLGPIEWSKSLGWLKNGNTRFIKGSLRKDGQSRNDVRRLVSGQKPHAVILSCSDSRVPPEIAFDQKLGEVFVVRAIGEALDSSTVSSVEYGVQHLGANLVVVLGHSHCGAVNAALTTASGGDTGTPDLNKVVHDIQAHLSTFAGKTPSMGLMEESWANVTGTAKDLYDRSEVIRTAVNSGDVKIVEAVYSLHTGVVTFR